MLRWLGNLANHLKVRLHNQSSSKQRKVIIICLPDHAFMTRNSNQTTRRSPPRGVDGWAWDYDWPSIELKTTQFVLVHVHLTTLQWHTSVGMYTVLWHVHCTVACTLHCGTTLALFSHMMLLAYFGIYYSSLRKSKQMFLPVLQGFVLLCPTR